MILEKQGHCPWNWTLAPTAYTDKRQLLYWQGSLKAWAAFAAGFYPKDVIVRLSDFKSNEYANLLGGSLYEPDEENPMIGWRGASRYYDPKYRPAFALEWQGPAQGKGWDGVDQY